MIPANFAYIRAFTPAEAADAYAQLHAEGKSALFYAGGSEIITMCRAGRIAPDAVIDIKSIPACRALSIDGDRLRLGAACTLNEIGQSKLFPLLRLSGGRIADHTNQCRITLGGNLCGTIRYRETSLPLLLADADVLLYGPEGERTVPFACVFDGRMRLKPGELIVQLHVPVWALSARHFHIKKTTHEKIDYPLISVAALGKDNRLRVALSGVCSHPFRSAALEDTVNDRTRSAEERAELALRTLPEPILSDSKGSGEYRAFVLKNTLCSVVREWEDASV